MLDASDDFTTKLLLNDACHLFRKPLINASMLQFQGQLSVAFTGVLKNKKRKLCYWDPFYALPQIFEFNVDPSCSLCTGRVNFATLWPLSTVSEVSVQRQISPAELLNRLAQNEDIFLLDVRNPDEHHAFNIGGALIPLSELPQRVDEIPTDKPIVLYCHSGYRSQVALEWLQGAGFKDLANLMGGVVAWQIKIL